MIVHGGGDVIRAEPAGAFDRSGRAMLGFRFAPTQPTRSKNLSRADIPESLPPQLVPERRAIQFFANQPPVGQITVHQRLEPVVMVPLQQVREFVNDDVFQATRRLFDQFQIQLNAAGADIASAPAGLHPFDAPVGDPHP